MRMNVRLTRELRVPMRTTMGGRLDALWLMPVAAVALGACTGTIAGDLGDPGNAGLGGGVDPAPDERPAPIDPVTGEPLAACTAVSPGPSPLRRLTRFEYSNTIRDLVGDTSRPADRFPPEEIGNGFGNDAESLGVSDLLTEQYFTAASGIVARLLADPPRLAGVLGCDPAQAGEEACARTLIDGFGQRAYRRPLDAGEKARLLAVYTANRAALDFKSSVGAVLETMLQTPQFLYRVEFGASPAAGSSVGKVDGYEMAARLSYLLWGSMPDQTLFAAAAAGQLGTADEVRAQAERMVADPRARDVALFMNEALFELHGVETLQKDPARFAAFTTEIAIALREESRRFIDHVVWDGAGDLRTLLTAPFSFVDAKLAMYYGAQQFTGVVPRTAAFSRVEMNPQRRAGLLTHGGLMATLTSGSITNPPIRGSFIRRKVLCSPAPPPPANLMIETPVPMPNQTTREVFETKTSPVACTPCHALLNPVGFALENFDPIGRWRDTDNGKPVNAAAELQGTDVAGPVAGPAELAQKLGASAEAGRCYVGQWLAFGYGRNETAADRCSRVALEGAFMKSGGNIKQLMVALTQTDAFLYRQAAGGQP